jgi:serine/threonine protein kinase
MLNARAANMLKGRKLEGGWEVIEQIMPLGFKSYSACYIVEKNGVRGFLKAFDYASADKVGSSGMNEIAEIIKAFKFEKAILEKCSNYSCKNIVEYYEDGEINIDGVSYPKVHYIIMEFSEVGDVNHVIQKKSNDLIWKTASLHQIAVGLNELHKIAIAHQDIKPENVVVFKDEVNKYRSKITDLGSALDLSSSEDLVPEKYFSQNYHGTWELSPPELLYGNVSEDRIVRRIGCDLYMLGSLVVFYFTEQSMNSVLAMNLADDLKWTSQTYGKYNDVKSYLVEAFERSLEDIGRQIDDLILRGKVMKIVRYLCHPDPLIRGHLKNTDPCNKDPRYGLARFISLFDWMHKYVLVKKY